MFSDPWVLALFAYKLLSYLAVSGSIAATFLLLLPALAQGQSQSDSRAFRQWLKRLVLGWSAAGVVLALLYLPLQAGALAEAGIAGMADRLMLQMVWQSAMRTQLLLLLCGFATLWLWAWRVKHSNKVVSITLVSIAALLLAASFSQTGHVASLTGLWQLLLTLHVLAIAAWVGSLLPLWQSCYRLAPDRLLALMQQFGRVAVMVVLVLISCGVLILLQLLDSPAALFVTDYGRLMLLKLMLVAAMLLLAAWHKFNLVKALAQHQNSRLLARSIFIEMLLALLVLVTCSSFTTVVGLAR